MANIELNNQLRETVDADPVDFQRVKELLELGADPNWFSKELAVCAVRGRILTIAISVGSPGLVRLLLEHGTDVNVKDEATHGLYPLPQAVIQQIHPEDVRALIEFGADINHRSRNGASGIMHLMADDVLPNNELLPLVEIIGDIHERYFVSGETFLHLVRGRENDEDKVALLERFLQACIPINSRDFEGDTPLHNMVSIACIDSISFLVKSGADIHARNNNGETVLHTLAENSHYPNFAECLQFLVESGANIQAVDGYGRTALHHASGGDDTTVDAVRELADIGVGTNLPDVFGKNEIHRVVSKINSGFTDEMIAQCINVITALVEMGVDINNGGKDGFMPLHRAVNKHNTELINAMINLGAGLTKSTQCGITPLHLATLRFDLGPQLVEWCVKQGLNLNEKDTYGSTPLHYSVWFREQSVIVCLLKNGADPTIKDNSGSTPADLARKLHFPCFETKLESFNIAGEADDTMHANDPFEECPITEYVYLEPDKETTDLQFQKWKEHISLHVVPIAEFISILLHSEQMGLFYDVKENHDIPILINNFMQRLATRLSERNPLFQCDLRLAGSTFEGTKTGVPDEFDYIWCLSKFSEYFSPVESLSCPSGFVKLRLNNSDTIEQDFTDFVDEDGYLDGRTVISIMYSILNGEIVKMFHGGETPGCFILGPMLDCSSGSLSSFSFNYCGQDFKLIIISVDVVPTISPKNWKPAEFIHLESRVLKNLDTEPPFSVVLKSPDENFVPASTFYFRKSYAAWEQSMIRSFPLYLRKGYIIVKALVESPYFPALIHPDNSVASKFVTSYRLKMCFLHQLEEALCREDASLSIPESETELQNKASLDWAQRIVRRLEEFVNAGHFPSFFERSKNLLLIEGAPEVFNTHLYKGQIECLKVLLGTMI